MQRDLVDPYKDGKIGFPEVPLVNNTVDTLGLDDDLTQDSLEKIREVAVKNLEEILSDNAKVLQEDSKKFKKQNYAVVSYVGPTFTAKTKLNGMSFLGVFENLQEAREYAMYASKKCKKKYDVYIVEMYKFIASWPESTDTQESYDKFLADIVKEHRIETEVSRLSFEVRKHKLKNNKDRFIEKERIELPIVNDEIPDPNPENGKDNNENSNEVDKSNRKKYTFDSDDSDDDEDKKDLEYLTKINVKMDEYNFVAVTFVGANHEVENKRCAIKIRKFFETLAQAETFCKELQQIDPIFDTTVVQMYNWIQCNPDLSNINVVHDNDKLNKLLNTSENTETEVSNFVNGKTDVTDKVDVTELLQQIEGQTVPKKD